MRGGQRRPISLTLQTSLVQDNVPVEVVPKVWIGSVHAAFNCEAIQDRQITHILNVSGLPATFPKQFTYLSIELRDKSHANLLGCIPAANIFMEAGVDSGGVLVHCAGGRSRSPALVCAYLMSTMNITFSQAFARVKAARNVVALNKGFESQLLAYEKAGCDVFEAHQVMLQQRLVKMAILKQKGARYDCNAVKSPSGGGNRPTSPSRLRLMRPGSPSVQVIPPLRGMGTLFSCRACGTVLFCTANIISHDSRSAPEKWDWNSPLAEVEQMLEREAETKFGAGPSKAGKIAINNASARSSKTPAVTIDITVREAIGGASHQQAAEHDAMVQSMETGRATPHPNPVPIRGQLSLNLSSLDAEDTKVKGSHNNQERLVHNESELKEEPQLQNHQLQQSVPDVPMTDHVNGLTMPRKPEIIPRQLALTRSSQDSPAAGSPLPLAPGTHRMWTAERRRWLAKMQALEEDSKTGHPSSQLAQTVAADEEHIKKLPCDYCYLEPLPWMGALDEDQGILYCPNEPCQASLGSWAWAGERCECQGYIMPAFRVETRHITSVHKIVGVVPEDVPKVGRSTQQQGFFK